MKEECCKILQKTNFCLTFCCFFFVFLLLLILFNFCRDPEMISITSAPEAPPPRIRILDSRQREVETVRIGDKLTFRIEIPEDSK